MYKVLKAFTDLQDNFHSYKVNDVYPRKGYEPSAERIAELSGSNNLQGKVLIQLVEEKPAVPKKAAAKKATKKPADE